MAADMCSWPCLDGEVDKVSVVETDVSPHRDPVGLTSLSFLFLEIACPMMSESTALPHGIFQLLKIELSSA